MPFVIAYVKSCESCTWCSAILDSELIFDRYTNRIYTSWPTSQSAIQISMQRALLPNVLASLGLVLILLATVMPLFEWRIKINSDFSSTYEVHFEPSPWTTKFGEALDDRSYTFNKVWVLMGEAICTNDEEYLVVLRPPNEKSLESLSVNADEGISGLILWSFIEIILSGIYIWWFVVWKEHRPISDAIIPVVISAIFLCFLIAILRLVAPKITVDYFMISDQCHGSLTLRARLSKIHYETLIVVFVGILGEFIALGFMLRQWIMTIIQRKEPSKSMVG